MALSIFGLVLCLAVCLGIGFVGSLASGPAIHGWYAALAKPAGTHPNSVFPIVWKTLNVLMALSWWLLWDRPAHGRRAVIALFLVQLGLNAAWSPVFFGMRGVAAGLLTSLPW